MNQIFNCTIKLPISCVLFIFQILDTVPPPLKSTDLPARPRSDSESEATKHSHECSPKINTRLQTLANSSPRVNGHLSAVTNGDTPMSSYPVSNGVSHHKGLMDEQWTQLQGIAGPSQDCSKLPALGGVPNIGDTIAYKVNIIYYVNNM